MFMKIRAQTDLIGFKFCYKIKVVGSLKEYFCKLDCHLEDKQTVFNIY